MHTGCKLPLLRWFTSLTLSPFLSSTFLSLYVVSPFPFSRLWLGQGLTPVPSPGQPLLLALLIPGSCSAPATLGLSVSTWEQLSLGGRSLSPCPTKLCCLPCETAAESAQQLHVGCCPQGDFALLAGRTGCFGGVHFPETFWCSKPGLVTGQSLSADTHCGSTAVYQQSALIFSVWSQWRCCNCRSLRSVKQYHVHGTLYAVGRDLELIFHFSILAFGCQKVLTS